MQQAITIKCKLKLQSPFDEIALTKSLEQYRQAYNAVSQYMFNHLNCEVRELQARHFSAG